MLPRVARLPSLTGLRWFAALAVFACHIFQQGIFADQKLGAELAKFTPLGSIAVSFFFVLSGFVLTWSARGGDSVPAFWRRRFAKIYPLHFVTLCIAGAIILGLSEPVLPGGSVWDGLVPDLLLLQSWLPEPSVISGFNTPSWSLSCEMAFYLSFPLWFRLFRRMSGTRLWWWAGGLAAAVVCVPFVAALLPESAEVAPGMPLNELWFVYWFPPVRALEFVLGVVMALILGKGLWRGPGVGLSALLLAGGFALTQAVPSMFTLQAATVVPATLLITAAADADVRGLRTWGLRSAVLVRLGEWSFAFYLVHFIVIRYGHRLLGGDLGYGKQWDTPGAIGVALLGVAVATCAAALLHTFVEKPAMRLLGGRRGAAARRDVTAPAPAPVPAAGTAPEQTPDPDPARA
ncbi:acyltransferase family protein [Streptomyces albireticuli]|uniref:Acyltransferase n=1 Tax=Streptomyces albireticuli TaxID=1940 RepID=A0A2A2D7R4_9ACTN|nr:acyltransferase [Streptomyces albireticuli]MCD9140526.1 acyltransferase [Streptomyces albireticuli]MCD9161512.1 acyltransferase [Streptomyces albireticuli]MCD9192918.1 acyltransferase [Streptomyces albireticuli]PAU47487.1 acyltransferase [Streptomyces albireticuli]